jgi:hypothetical protein
MALVNERLHSVLAQRGVSPESLAEACEVDPNTVGRWHGGRLPPAPQRGPRQPGGMGSDLVGTYQNRASVPREMWLSLLREAETAIDVLVFSGTFFAQSNPHVVKMLAARADDGVRVRLCFGDPTGQAVALRGLEEGIGDTLAAKIRASLTYYRPLLPYVGCEVRLHDTTLYTSLFRYDDTLLVNPHIYGQPASANPLLHLKRADPAGWFDTYTDSFNTVWATSRPWTPDQEERAAHGQD